ncbi:15947_t:CDS:2 [Acaulospora colombiana]|uniref:15947_t:CDS:1 n=1 Tax=Acaulospora colombiana TaxID=27376 RepID=A0ACA9LAL2_9GLOM|nr:15947_t:CDS:2 [Acaulospora colombiana]
MSRGDSGYMSHYGSIYSSKSDGSVRESYDTLDDGNMYDIFSGLTQSSFSEKRNERDDNDSVNHQALQPFRDYSSADHRPTTPQYPFLQQEPSLYENQNEQAQPQSHRTLRKYPSSPSLNRAVQTTAPTLSRFPSSHQASPSQQISPPQQIPPSHSPRLSPASTSKNYLSSPSPSPRLSPVPSPYNSHPFTNSAAHSPRLSPVYLPNNNSNVNLTSHSPRLSPVYLAGNNLSQGNTLNPHQYNQTKTHVPLQNGDPYSDHASQGRNHKSMPANSIKINKIIPTRSNTHDGQLKPPVLPQIDDNLGTSDFAEIHDFIDHYYDSDDKTTTRTPTEANSSEGLAAKNRKREAAVSEILTTERTYVDGLRKLVNIFLLPLQENFKYSQKAGLLSSKPVTSMEEINSIFSNIIPLLSLHEQLLKSLEERMTKWSPTEIISDVFLRIAPFLKMYTTYLQSFPHAINTLERLNKENKDFKKFLQFCQGRPELGNLPFNSFLSLPIQRIPRYKLLLDALIKHTDESHPDYANLQKCFRQITEIADEVNEKIRDVENQQKVLEIQYKIDGLVGNIVDPARRFIYEGALYKVIAQSDQMKPRFLATQEIRIHFLFSDLLIFCSYVQGKLTFKGKIDLNRASIVNLADDDADEPFCFQIIAIVATGEEKYTFRARSAREKAEWLDKLEYALSGLKNVIRGQKNTETRVPYKQAALRAADDLFIGSNRNNRKMRELRPQVSHGNLNKAFDSH